MSESDAARPTLRIVRGDATAEEIAALTALIAATSSAGSPEPPSRVRRGGWNDPARMHRPPLLPGPNAWRSHLA